MPDATTTTTTTTTAPSDTPSNLHHDNPSSARLPSQTWACSTCQASFNSGSEQRDHMKDAWHVENLKRKFASLPPLPRPAGSPPRISVEYVNHQHKHSPGNDTLEHGSSREVSDNEDDEYVSPFECLFCSEAFEPVGASDDESSTCLDSVIEHMRTAHGFTIPQQESITDLENFHEYLGTVVKLWHEFLNCGASGSSTRGIQNHMKDKRHCQLNLEREPELLEFWDRDDESGEEAGKEEGEEERRESTKDDGISTANLVSDTEIRLSSGKILGSRRAPTARKPRTTYSSTALVKAKDDSPSRSSSQSEPHPKIPDAGAPKDRRVIRRGDMMGIIGLQEHQHRALVYAEKAAQHREVTARKRHQWAYEKRANSQKHDQLQTGPMAKAKAGLHQLLPR